MTNTPIEIDPFIAAGLKAFDVEIPEKQTVEDFRKSVEKLKADHTALSIFMKIYLTNKISWRDYFDSISDLAKKHPIVYEAGSRFIEAFASAAPHAKSAQLFLPATTFPIDANAADAVAEMFLRGGKKYSFQITANILFVESPTLSKAKRTKLLRKGVLKEINTPITLSYFESEACSYMKSIINTPTAHDMARVGYNESIVNVTLPAYINSFPYDSEQQKLAIIELVKLIKTFQRFENVIRTDAYTFDSDGQPLFINYFSNEDVIDAVNKTVESSLSLNLSKIQKTVFNTVYGDLTTVAVENAILSDIEAASAWLANPNVSRETVEKIYETHPALQGIALSVTHPDASIPYFIDANEESLARFQKLADEME